MPSIFPWNKSAAVTPKNSNSPSTSKPSTPPPSEKSGDDCKVIKLEKTEVEIKKEAEDKPAVVAVSSKRNLAVTRKSVSAATKSPKKSKRLSAKINAAPKIKSVAIPETPEKIKLALPPAAATPKKKNQVVNFVPGSSIEAQNFDGKWMPVKVIEVDMDEREVLVRSIDKNNKSKTG